MKMQIQEKKKQSSDVLDYFFEIVNSMDYRIEGRNSEKKPKMEKKVFLNLSKNMKMKIKQKDIIFFIRKNLFNKIVLLEVEQKKLK